MTNNVFVDILKPFEMDEHYRELKGSAKRLFSLLTVSSLFIGGTGFFKTFMAFVFMGANPVVQVCLVGFLTTFSVYSLNKLTDLKEDAVNMPERLRFLAGRKNLVLCYSLAAYALSILLAFMDMPSTVPIIFIPLVANLVYGSKLLPCMPRFKDIPVMKNLFVAATWALCATLLSAMHSNVSSIAIIVFLFILIKSFINTVIYDIRDEEGDRDNGVKTIPVLLGKKKAVYVLLLMNSALLVLLLFAGSLQPITIAMVLYGYAYILYFRERRNPLVLDLFVDGEWMYACALFVALNGCRILA
jgi:4-hydroxybenzoate polyprenyltransferase